MTHGAESLDRDRQFGARFSAEMREPPLDGIRPLRKRRIDTGPPGARRRYRTGNATGEYLPAVAPLERLLREHPRSAYAGDARALRLVIGAYIVRTAERDRLAKQLRAVDLEFERPSVPLASGP